MRPSKGKQLSPVVQGLRLVTKLQDCCLRTIRKDPLCLDQSATDNRVSKGPASTGKTVAKRRV